MTAPSIVPIVSAVNMEELLITISAYVMMLSLSDVLFRGGVDRCASVFRYVIYAGTERYLNIGGMG